MKKILIIGVIMLMLASTATVMAKGIAAPPKSVPYHPPENQLTKLIFIRYAPGVEKAKACDYDNVCDPDEGKWCADCKNGVPDPDPEPTSACYDFLSDSKPTWKSPEDYYYSSVLAASSDWATGVWNGAVTSPIFGNGYEGNYTWGVYDLINSVSYGDYPEPGVIGVTAIWYRAKTIYEYDIMLDEDYFPGEGTTDLNTIMLHEFGHAAGLGDLYNSVCSEEVMYGWYSPNTIKDELQEGDIAGITTLYGA